MTPIPFFTDDITIRPHTATHAEDIGRLVSLRSFADRHDKTSLALYQLDNGELRAEVRAHPRAPFLAFIEGEEA